MEFLLILLMNALFAATFPVGKLALAYCGPTFLIAIRMLMAGCLLSIYSYLYGHTRKITVRDGALFAKTALFYVVLAFIPEFWAMQYISSIKANLLWSVQPFLAALLGFLIFSEKLTSKKIAALVIGFTGLMPIMFTCNSGELSISKFCSASYPELAMFVAVFSTIYAWFLIKKLLEKNYALSFINGITMSLGGLACLGMSLGQNYIYHEALYTNLYAVFGYSFLLVLISNVVAYGLYGYFLSRYSITFLSFSGFTCPLFGFLYSYMLGEQIYAAYIYGCALIIVGLYLFYKEE